MSTDLKFEHEARAALFDGATKVYKAVSSTLGARGRNVVRQIFGSPKITNDGVTIAEAIDLADPFERQGADLMKQAARKTVKQAGDGTTTSIVLAYAFLKYGNHMIERGTNPMLIKSMIEKEVPRVIEQLKTMAIPIAEQKDLENIANISVQSPEHGKIVADATAKAGKDGQVIVEEDYSTMGVKMEEVDGYRFDRGVENPFLFTDPEKMQAVFDKQKNNGQPFHVLVSDKSWNLVGDLHPLISELKKAGIDKLLIIADEISGELMQYFTVNRMQLRFHAVIVKSPFNKDMLEDIAQLTGATAVTASKGIVNVKREHLGLADKIIATQDTTTIIGGAGDVTKKIDELRQQIENSDEGYDKEKLKDRLARLTGKVVVLKVGAATEAEAKYLKDKLDDAVGATKAAVEEGVVPGGGMALHRVAHTLYTDFEDEFGAMMFSVLTSPVDKIVSNAGIANSEEIMEELSQSEYSGFDALTGKVVENVVNAGILDPVKVTRCALENAASLAAMLLTTDTVIAEMPENFHEKANR